MFDTGRMLEAVARVAAAVGECVDAPAWALSDDDLLAALDETQRAQQTLAAVTARLVREIEGRELPAARHATSTAAWLRERLRISPHAAKRLVELARAADRRPELAAAWGGGLVNSEQAATIAGAIDNLPAAAGPEAIGRAEAILIGYAEQFDPAALRTLGERVLAHVDPDAADAIDARALARAQARAQAGRTLALTNVGDGQVRLTGWLDTESAATVTAALDPLCAPVSGDTRTPGQRRADALTDVCRLALRTGELPANGGDRPQLVVTVAYEALRRDLDALAAGAGLGGAGFGALDTGDRLTPAQVRRLACDAQIIPAILDGDGQLLDLGRTRRLFTGAVRRALVLRDGGCAFPACDRPARWCDAHHIRPWADGGPTAVDNGVLLCGYHHRLIHQGAWSVRLGSDGLPEFIPPAHLDPQRRPRRNVRQRTARQHNVRQRTAQQHNAQQHNAQQHNAHHGSAPQGSDHPGSARPGSAHHRSDRAARARGPDRLDRRNTAYHPRT